MAFPDKFVWGAAAASYQIEGGAYDDGKGLNVWDVFSHTPNKVYGGDTGDVACDHYHRYADDVALMKEIGLQAYRLSVSWARVLPDGIGKVNDAGLDYYDRLIDTLLAANIQPYVTLFHWDCPYELYCKGGWLNRDSADWFAEYTGVLANKLGDRVQHWMTLNEPAVFVNMGYESGEHAPGEKWGDHNMSRIVHHVLLAHGKSVQVLRDTVADAQIGLAWSTAPDVPLINDEAHINASRERYWDASNRWNNALWLDPMLKGEYPAKALELWERYLPIQDGDMTQIQQALDFIGLNIYFGSYLAIDDDGQAVVTAWEDGHTRTMMDWRVVPETLYWGPKFIYERYGLPIYITENGLASMDWVSVDGKVHDAGRIDFLTRYLRQFEQAGADGVDIAGYFQWSVMDNFEWAEGYRKRFGLIYVDFETQKRTLKDSAYWYRDVIASNGATLFT